MVLALEVELEVDVELEVERVLGGAMGEGM